MRVRGIRLRTSGDETQYCIVVLDSNLHVPGLADSINPDWAFNLAADLIVGPIAVRLFFTGARISPRIVAPVVELALRGLRSP